MNKNLLVFLILFFSFATYVNADETDNTQNHNTEVVSNVDIDAESFQEYGEQIIDTFYNEPINEICILNPDFKLVNMQPYKIFKNEKGVYFIEITAEKEELIPVVVENLETNETVYNKYNPKFVVNTGFFDPKNQKTVSYIVINGEVVANPTENESLMQNAALKPHLGKILNRSEFRIIEDKNGNILYDICPHDYKVEEGYKLKHSIQAGPMLLPDFRIEEEFFVLVKGGKIISESASSLHKYARTAIGIKDNRVYIFVIPTEAPMTLKEVAELAESFGMEKAMAFDGGGSTSFDSKELHIISEKDNQARKLKSFLMLK